MSLFLFQCYNTSLCQKSERSKAWFSRKSVTGVRTDERTEVNKYVPFLPRQGTKNLTLAKNGKNLAFLAKISKRIFFSNISRNSFLESSRCSFVQKSLKSGARFSRYAETNRQTDAYTPGRTSMNP